MANYQYVTSTGLIVPDTSEIQAQVLAEYQAALGVDIVPDASTPQGTLVVAETAARVSMLQHTVDVANQINPNYAGNVWLDDICALTDFERQLATASTAVVEVTGTIGTYVDTTVTFRSTNGYLWRPIAVTLMDESPKTLTVKCTVSGAIGAAANTISQIYVGTIGLETVTNPDPAVAGSSPQSDVKTREARKNQLALQGANLPAALQAALYALPEVKSITYRENRTATAGTFDGVYLVAHSIWVCVDGGTNESIAQVLLGKTAGCNWNGSIEVSATEPSSGQDYLVKFERPEEREIQVRVTCRAVNPLINPQTSVRSSILSYAAGEIDGESGFVLGASVSPFELAGAINTLTPEIYVKKVEVKFVGSGSFTTDELDITIIEKASVEESAIEVITY